MSDSKNLRLTDEAIGLIAKSIQVAMLTGTDVVDNLRMMTFELSETFLSPTREYVENFDKNVDSLILEAVEIINNTETTDLTDDDEIENPPMEHEPYMSPLDGPDEQELQLALANSEKTEVDVDEW